MPLSQLSVAGAFFFCLCEHVLFVWVISSFLSLPVLWHCFATLMAHFCHYSGIVLPPVWQLFAKYMAEVGNFCYASSGRDCCSRSFSFSFRLSSFSSFSLARICVNIGWYRFRLVFSWKWTIWSRTLFIYYPIVSWQCLFGHILIGKVLSLASPVVRIWDRNPPMFRIGTFGVVG